MSSPPLKEIAPWTYRFIWINVIIFAAGQVFWAVTDANPISEWMSLRIGHLIEGKVWEVFTYMWVHSDFLIVHIIFNMMTLYFLGRLVEFKLGSRAFLWIYLLGGLASVGLFIADVGVQTLFFNQPIDLETPLVGASGAVCAVLGVFSLLAPDTKLYFMFLPWPVRAIKMVRGFVWFSAIAIFLGWIPAIRESISMGWFFSVAHSAHLGGILFGWWCLRKIQNHANPPYTPYRVVSDNPPEIPPEQMNSFELRQALDPILSKLSSQGVDSLTERELKILQAGRQLFG
ncbi:MAG: rhomboid family intramembrane serine protease [Verrucomicrobiota bacterium]